MDLLITEDLQSPALDELGRKYELTREPLLWKDPARLRAVASQARALVIRNQTQVNAELLAGAPRLVAIGRVGVGLDNIDVGAATRLGVVVVAPLNANAVSVAELTMALALALARKLTQADRSTKAGAWDRKACTGSELDGKVLGLCGFGRIGRLVGARARAFGMRLAVFDPYVKSDAPALRESQAQYCAQLGELLAVADFISIHLPLTPETRELFNTRAFAAMKPGAFFINTSRGGVVEEGALLEALKRGQLGGAALDVRAVEPPAGGSGYEELPNVILTPHIGAFTQEAQQRTFEAVASDLDLLLSGRPALNYVNLDQPRVRS